MSRSATIYLVRHAKAGSRYRWNGNDHERPLSGPGREQAAALAVRLAAKRPPTLLSSPYVRCMQTLEPLADALGTEVVAQKALYEGEPFEPVLELLAEVDTRTVLCSHGDIIPATIDALIRRGMEVDGEPDWRKGATWVLKRRGGAITVGKAWPPPSSRVQPRSR